jgi:ABC-type bacteriocin/lantibiotic exporter with double-glycine peptidase domain
MLSSAPNMEPIIAQRRDQDCGVAALALYVHRRYEDVFVAAIQRCPTMVKDGGLTLDDLVAIAKSFGYGLKRVHYRKVDLDSDAGVLGVNWNKPKEHGSRGHWVVLREGTIICPRLPSVWDADDYLKIENGRVGTLLVREDA